MAMYQAQVSNDGVNWADATGVSDSWAAASGGSPRVNTTKTVLGAFIRFNFTMQGTGGAGTYGVVNFDLHVLLDNA